MPTEQPPLWQALQDALDEAGLSVRGFAKRLHKAYPHQSWESWRGSLREYLDPDNPKVASRRTAALMAKQLGKPDDYFVRPQQREQVRKERDRLREENAQLRRLLREAGIRLADE